MNFENLTSYYKNIYSQRGEDGIIEEIFNRLNIKNGNCVEFGGGDGITCSNTRNLIDKGWSGCFIEFKEESYCKLQKNYSLNKNVICIKKYINQNGDDTLDNILYKNFNKKIDLISIDIDGCDYEIFNSINKFLPTLFIVECNPYRNPLDSNYYGYCKNHIQESLFIFNKLAESKNYKLICYTQNIFFIKNEFFNLFHVSDNLLDHFLCGLKILKKYEDLEVFDRILNRLKYNKCETVRDVNWLINLLKII